MCSFSLSSTLRYCCVGPAPFDDIGDIPYLDKSLVEKSCQPMVWSTPVDTCNENTQDPSSAFQAHSLAEETVSDRVVISQLASTEKKKSSMPLKIISEKEVNVIATQNTGENDPKDDDLNQTEGGKAAESVPCQESNRNSHTSAGMMNGNTSCHMDPVHDISFAHAGHGCELYHSPSNQRRVVQDKVGESHPFSPTLYLPLSATHSQNKRHVIASWQSRERALAAQASSALSPSFTRRPPLASGRRDREKGSGCLINTMTACMHPPRPGSISPQFDSLETQVLFPPFTAPKTAWQDSQQHRTPRANASSSIL